MKKIILSLFCAWSMGSYAQYDATSLEFSIPHQLGTARGLGAGNIFGSVGADFSAAISNPAGMGLYKKSEFSISPGVRFSNVDATYTVNNETENAVKLKMTLGNLGVVFAKKKTPKRYTPTLTTSNFFIGYNQIQNFNTIQSVSGYNSKSSYTDNPVNELNVSINTLKNIVNSGGTNEEIYQELYQNFTPEAIGIYQTYLALPLDTTGSKYGTPITGVKYQNSTIEKSGRVNEMQIGWAGGIKDKLFIGATLGIPVLKYNSTYNFSEADSGNTNSGAYSLGYFRKMSVTDNTSYKGTGVNLKLGILYRINDYVRVSTAFTTPSLYSITQTNNYKINSTFDSAVYEENSYQSTFNYQMNTPFKWNVGMSGFFKKYGFIAAEYELTDYSTMKVVFPSEYSSAQSVQNKLIKNKYTTSHTFKLGAEAAIEEFRIRAGYNLRTAALKDDVTVQNGNLSSQTFSGGVGYRDDKWGLDIGYARTTYNDYTSYYASTNGDAGSLNKHIVSDFLATLILKFK